MEREGGREECERGWNRGERRKMERGRREEESERGGGMGEKGRKMSGEGGGEEDERVRGDEVREREVGRMRERNWRGVEGGVIA